MSQELLCPDIPVENPPPSLKRQAELQRWRSMTNEADRNKYARSLWQDHEWQRKRLQRKHQDEKAEIDEEHAKWVEEYPQAMIDMELEDERSLPGAHTRPTSRGDSEYPIIHANESIPALILPGYPPMPVEPERPLMARPNARWADPPRANIPFPDLSIESGQGTEPAGEGSNSSRGIPDRTSGPPINTGKGKAPSQ